MRERKQIYKANLKTTSKNFGYDYRCNTLVETNISEAYQCF